MAKMHTKRKGQSGSKKPLRTEVPDWANVSAEEATQLILEMWKQGVPTSQIGMILRDQYGVGDVKLLTGKKVTQILKDNEVAPALPEDMTNLIVKALKLRKHLTANKHDLHNKRALQLTESKIRRLVKYYHTTKVLPAGWIYKPETAEMMLSR